MITTREITLTPNTFFRILLNLNFRFKTRMLYAVAAVLAVVWIVIYPDHSQLYLLLAAVCLFPMVIIFLTWRTAHNKINSSFTRLRSYTINKEQVTASLEGGDQELFDIKKIHRVNRTSHYYLLFTTPVEFIYLPYDAFLSDADLQWFEKNVVNRARSVRGKSLFNR